MPIRSTINSFKVIISFGLFKFSRMKNCLKFSILFLACMVAISCKNSKKAGSSSATGWKYNDPKNGGFEKLNYEGQETGPNLVLIEGGTFTMGNTQEDVTYEWNNVPRRVTVSSFYMDETEVTNINYREYLFWLQRTFSETYPKIPRAALPDTLVWRTELAYNEPMVNTYFRHPAYDDYPVVGVTWLQADEFCKWRSDRVNEGILVDRGVLNLNPAQKDSDNFNTDAYLAGQYQGSVKKNLKDLSTGGERPVRFEDGILLPAYRLPTEAEWEYAALALIGNRKSNKDELLEERKIFTWNGNTARYQRRDRDQGKILANFKMAGGDYMGTAGKLNDHASYTSAVKTFMPNDYGLYNMGGNVSEWVADVYRPQTQLTLRDAETQDLNSFRGNRFTQFVKDENGNIVEKDSMGRLRREAVNDSITALRENYKKSDVVNYMDGDADSEVQYLYGVSSLVSDKARVIKGGSWADRLFWCAPGARRFKDEDKADMTIGFRCAMTRVGGPVGNEDTGGNNFKRKPKAAKRR